MKNKGREETVEVIDFNAEERILNSEPVKRKQEAFFFNTKEYGYSKRLGFDFRRATLRPQEITSTFF